ncbi:CocE/NonD family hydrolase [Spongisporangium articulatum]|uniref:CocE/NonD family hydrolase n=1 Tax=Spongisporangium articulatum TaxID=3362603 RepID=A0ABW8AKR4_9ACTN
MTHRSGATRRSVLLAPALLAAGLTVARTASPAAAAVQTGQPTTSTKVTIPTRDGFTLAATVNKPLYSEGRLPVVIMPGTFAGNTIDIDRMAVLQASRGYIAVNYTERGFGKSTGKIDAAGPLDVNDVSDVLDWVLAHTDADPDRVGSVSISYGAGFLPMVGVQDHRFKALAMISGWGDLWKARYPNGTSAWASNVALYTLAETQGKPSDEVRRLFQNMIANKYTADMKAAAALRSPMTYLPQLQKHAVPTYFSTSMNEMIWPEDQTLEFFDAYPGVKHLDILPGDHATTELGQPVGSPGVTWTTAFEWMDAYVGGYDDAAKGLPLIRVAPRSPTGTNILESKLLSDYAFEGYTDLTPTARSRQYLATSSSMFGLITKTSLATSPGSDAKKLRMGKNLLMNQGIPMYEGAFEIVTGAPTTVPLSIVDQGVTGVWTGPELKSPLKLRGAIRSHLELVPSAAKGSVFVYLIDKAPNGTAFLVGHKPYSWTGATPGTKLPVDVTIPYNAYDVPAGHRLVFAVSTDDVMYTSNNGPLATVSVGSGSYVDIPLR